MRKKYMADSRIKNTKRNMFSGIIQQIVGIILPFITRTLILYKLGSEYQGLSGLFTSILQVLNLTDLGFSTAVVYVLYKPIANNDTNSICAIMAYFKKIYRVVGWTVLVLGVSLLPFLPRLIKGSYPDAVNIYILYCIYLGNSVISYWLFAYKSALLNAMQRIDITNNISTITRAGMNLVQIVLICVYKNYYLYVLVIPVFTIINNLMIEVITKKKYSQIIPHGTIHDEVRLNLIKQVKGIFISKIGDVARNGADNIFLSMLIGLTTVAIYNNYFYVYSSIYGVSLVLSNAMAASVGNSIVTESPQKNCDDLFKFSFIFSWFTCICTVCMCCLYQPFMLIWMRGDSKLLLSNLDMCLFCVYYYAITMNNIRNQYLNGAGLFWELRTWYILEAVGNIILNLILGKIFGVTGIILATIITVILFNFIARTNVLFRLYFKQNVISFYRQCFTEIIVTTLACIISFFACSLISMNGILNILAKGIVAFVISNIIFILFNCKTQRYKEAVMFLKRILYR